MYGGFETCVEEVGWRLAEAGHDVIVYCRRQRGHTDPQGEHFRGMQLVQLPAMRKRALETLTHTALSVAHLVRQRRVDAVVMFNAANAVWLPPLRLRRLPVVTHVDGLEWRRAKWGPIGRRYYRLAESLAVRWSDALIADAQGIADYYDAEFGAPTELIRYGAPIIDEPDRAPLVALGLEPHAFHLVVARFEPENHVDLIVEGFVKSAARFPLVVVGSAPYASDYQQRIRALADSRVHLLGAVWDQDLLNSLYANAFTYQHGHSVGGTNPSLLRAIGAGAPTDAFDVSFNREVIGDAGRFWRTPDDVAALIEAAESDPGQTRRRGVSGSERARTYTWEQVAEAYGDLCCRLARGELKRSGVSGRRRTPGWQE
jgi:glycosyltransferase involved in cell wall biosynthesis